MSSFFGLDQDVDPVGFFDGARANQQQAEQFTEAAVEQPAYAGSAQHAAQATQSRLGTATGLTKFR